MVDISAKKETHREARAQALVSINLSTLHLICQQQMMKGDVFAAARIAGIQAAKRTWELIPLCHALALNKVEILLEVEEAQQQVKITALCCSTGKTGVEMETLTAVSVAALTLYDMCKAVQKDITIEQIRLLSKVGGKSGEFRVKDEN